MSNMEINRGDGSHTYGRDAQKRAGAPAKVAGAGAFAEAAAGIGAVTLAILALAGVLPVAFSGIATIVVGAALILEGAAISKRLYDTRSRAGLPTEVTGGVSAESLAGIGGIVLGILYLAGVYPKIILPVAIIVLGAGAMLGGLATSRANALAAREPVGSETKTKVLHESVFVAADAHGVVGVGAIVLGIIALTGAAPFVLCLIALLAIGATEALSGSAIGSRFMTAAER